MRLLPSARLRLAALAPLLALAQTSCALLGDALQKPRVSLRDVQVNDVGFQGIAVTFVLGVDNPNPIGIDLSRLAYQITIDGHQLAAGSSSQAATVPAQGSGVVNLPLSIKFADFVQSLESFFQRDTVPYGLSTTLGWASPLGTIDIPLTTQGTFPVPRFPAVGFEGISMGSVDLTGATVNLGVHVQNTNPFAVPLGVFDYRVSVAGVPVIQSTAPPQSLAAGQRQVIPIVARIDFMKTGMAVLSAIDSGSATVAFDGTLDLGVLKHPVHFEQRLGR